jgi:hypothetical protein
LAAWTPPPSRRGLVAPVPLSGTLVGYGRVSTREQNLARQQARLTEVGCTKGFFDKASGKNADRPDLTNTFEYIRSGEALAVVSLDRLGRLLEDLIAIVGRLKKEGVGFRSLHERLGYLHPGRDVRIPRLRRAGRVHPHDHRGQHQ